MFMMCCKTARVVATWSLFHRSDSSWHISSPLTEVSNERTATDDPAAPDQTDPARHSEMEPGPPDRLSILDGRFGAVLSCVGNPPRPLHRFRGTYSRIARSGHRLAATPRDLLDRRPYFPREYALVLRWQQRQWRRHVRLGHGLLPAGDRHCRNCR